MSTTEEIIKEIIGKSLLLKIGQRSVVIIKKRVADGIFLEGSTPGAEKYSTKPFAMPIGAIKKKKLMMDILKGKHTDDTQLITSKKTGHLWVIIKKGYRWLREQSGKNFNKVDFTWTREFMRSLQVLKVNKTEVEIGHRGERNKQLAKWHNVMGAGKSKKIRKYLALTDKELQQIAEKL